MQDFYSKLHKKAQASQQERSLARNKVGVSENVGEHPIVPNGFADHYPYEKWLFQNIPYFQSK